MTESENMSINLFNNIELSSNSVLILHQNIRSLRANFDSFVLYLENLEKIPQIVILTEIWVSECESAYFKIPGYTQFVKYNDNYRAGGLVAYISETLSAISTNISEMYSADVLKLSIELSSELSLTVIAIYRLHSNPTVEFLKELQSLLETTHERNSIIIGDMNLCILHKSQLVDDYQTLMASYGLDQIIDSPTRVTKISKSCIDHIYFRSRDNFGIIGHPFDLGITDHHLTMCSLDISQPPYQGNECLSSLTKIDYGLLNELLYHTDWSDVLSQTNASLAYDVFIGKIKTYIDFSRVTYVSKIKRKSPKPWINRELSARIIKKNSLYKKHRKQPYNDKLTRYYESYKFRLQQDILKQKEDYYLNMFKTHRNNLNKQWKIIDNILGRGGTKNKVVKIRSQNNGSLLHCSQEIADEFGSYYSKTYDRINLVSPLSSDKIPSDYFHIFPTYSSQKSLYFPPTSTNEVICFIKELKSTNSSGVDGVSNKAVKAIHVNIAPIFAFIANLSMETGVFPEQFKTAVIVPIHKKGDKTDVNNYRPISLLPVFSKILEKIIKIRLVTFLTNMNFFSENQFGFRKGKCTEDALLRFCTDVYDGINSGKRVAGLFIDITKAFDNVDHIIIFERLYESGIRGIALDWFRSYLSGRSQIVKVDESYSNNVLITCGVPHGSVLGPILFLLYVNNLCNGSFNGNLTTFADDTSICYTAMTDIDLYLKMQADLDRLKLWFTVNKLVLSNKTKYMLFNLKKQTLLGKSLVFKCNRCLIQDIENCKDCVNIETVNNIKYIGLILDSNCNWKLHISKIRTELLFVIRQFYFLKYVCTLPVLKAVYYSFFNSRINYGIVCWGGAYHSNIRCLQVSQNKVIRIMMRATRMESSFPLYVNLNILPLRYLFVFKVLRVFFNRGGHINKPCFYSYNLRRNFCFDITKPNVQLYKQCYSFLAPKLFSTIPKDISSSANEKVFIRKLKNWLFLQKDLEDLLK